MILPLFFILQAPLLAFSAEIAGKNKAEAKGVLLMDSSTFPILMEELRPETRMLVGIFDKKQTVIQDPPTLENEARFNFLNFVTAYRRDESTDLSHLLFGQIIVNGAENKYLKNRLVGDRELPVFLILGENRTDPYVIDLDIRDYRYCTFISMLNSYAGYNNKLPGLLNDFDALVQRFIPAAREERLEIVAEAKQLYEAIEGKKELSDADYYISTMGKIMEQGLQYVKEEGGNIVSRARLPLVSDDRKYALDKKLNILESFLKVSTPEPIREAATAHLKTRDELSRMDKDL